MGRQVVAEHDRLGALEVGVAGQHEVAVGPRPLHQHGLQAGGAALEVGGGVHRPQAERGRDLVVARAAGVHALADLARAGPQLALDQRVHVLVVRVGLHRHGLQGRGDGLGVGRRHDALAGEHAHVRLRRADVVGQQPPVDGQRRREREEAGRARPPAGRPRAGRRPARTALAHPPRPAPVRRRAGGPPTRASRGRRRG